LTISVNQILFYQQKATSLTRPKWQSTRLQRAVSWIWFPLRRYDWRHLGKIRLAAVAAPVTSAHECKIYH